MSHPVKTQNPHTWHTQTIPQAKPATSEKGREAYISTTAVVLTVPDCLPGPRRPTQDRPSLYPCARFLFARLPFSGHIYTPNHPHEGYRIITINISVLFNHYPLSNSKTAKYQIIHTSQFPYLLIQLDSLVVQLVKSVKSKLHYSRTQKWMVALITTWTHRGNRRRLRRPAVLAQCS